VLAVREGATAEVITAGENGFLVDSPDPGMLTDAILSIRENPEQIRMIAEKGQKMVREKYTVEIQLLKTEGIIRKCLES
jgi:glycosyltransferase involved in cell wall biosynthesis